MIEKWTGQTDMSKNELEMEDEELEMEMEHQEHLYQQNEHKEWLDQEQDGQTLRKSCLKKAFMTQKVER